MSYSGEASRQHLALLHAGLERDSLAQTVLEVPSGVVVAVVPLLQSQMQLLLLLSLQVPFPSLERLVSCLLLLLPSQLSLALVLSQSHGVELRLSQIFSIATLLFQLSLRIGLPMNLRLCQCSILNLLLAPRRNRHNRVAGRVVRRRWRHRIEPVVQRLHELLKLVQRRVNISTSGFSLCLPTVQVSHCHGITPVERHELLQLVLRRVQLAMGGLGLRLPALHVCCRHGIELGELQLLNASQKLRQLGLGLARTLVIIDSSVIANLLSLMEQMFIVLLDVLVVKG
mmetsp:Transcript_15189/g.25219  ORF Transcript_15189/g.25219 Transcript_15189/m.25219 type:complete len:285 (-) Transcript_15189:170-1024(-)